ncbi:MAG: hypothetical protein AAGH81_05630 [Bacteroidota bacterium]
MKTTQKLFLLLLLVLISACRKDDNGAYGYHKTEGFEVKELPINGGQIAMIHELS